VFEVGTAEKTRFDSLEFLSFVDIDNFLVLILTQVNISNISSRLVSEKFTIFDFLK
jgi:hypothetical protein